MKVCRAVKIITGRRTDGHVQFNQTDKVSSQRTGGKYSNTHTHAHLKQTNTEVMLVNTTVAVFNLSTQSENHSTETFNPPSASEEHNRLIV